MLPILPAPEKSPCGGFPARARARKPSTTNGFGPSLFHPESPQTRHRSPDSTARCTFPRNWKMVATVATAHSAATDLLFLIFRILRTKKKLAGSSRRHNTREWASPFIQFIAASSTADLFSPTAKRRIRSEEHTSELQSLTNLVCRLLLEKK